MCKKDRQKIKDYQKQYRENMADEQKQKYKNNLKQYIENVADEQKKNIYIYIKIIKNNIKNI